MQAPFHVVFTIIHQIDLDLCRAFIKISARRPPRGIFLKSVFSSTLTLVKGAEEETFHIIKGMLSY